MSLEEYTRWPRSPEYPEASDLFQRLFIEGVAGQRLLEGADGKGCQHPAVESSRPGLADWDDLVHGVADFDPPSTVTMQYRQLGKSGLKVSAVSFGAWVTFGKQIGDPVARSLLHAAYDAGINFFDNAESYADGKAEVVMGAILKKAGWRRSSYLVSSKVFFGGEGDRPNEDGLSRKHVVEACHGSRSTTSTSTTAIGRTPASRSRRHAARCMT